MGTIIYCVYIQEFKVPTVVSNVHEKVYKGNSVD